MEWYYEITTYDYRSPALTIQGEDICDMVVKIYGVPVNTDFDTVANMLDEWMSEVLENTPEWGYLEDFRGPVKGKKIYCTINLEL